jgi:uncharacterized membrane-anchored protein YitT (DUF2179 family)
MSKKGKFKRAFLEYLGIGLGCLMTAVGLIIFLVPNKIAAGGVSGLATLIYYLTGFPVGTAMLLFNIPLFIIGVKVLGRHMGFRTLFGIVILSVGTDLLGPFFPVLTHDPLLASLYGGAVCGVGMGLVFKFRGTTGGTDLVASLLHRFFPTISIGQGLLIVDAFVIALAGLVFSAELALYAVVALFISSKVIDLIQEGFNLAKALFIISDHADEICVDILEKMGRGVTTLCGKGGYTGQPKNVLLVVVSRTEVAEVKALTLGRDPRAFVILTDVHEVMGEGFQEWKPD